MDGAKFMSDYVENSSNQVHLTWTIRRLQDHIMNENSIGKRAKNGIRDRKLADTEAINGEAPPMDGDNTVLRRLKSHEQEERSKVVLWRHPIITLYYFAMETLILIHDFGLKLVRNRKLVGALVLTFLCMTVVYLSNGPHQQYVSVLRKEFMWCIYWVGLGILSSVGLGTGLHTFLLYLGPHIASVTLAAYECQTVNFPSPPYPDDIICPEEEGKGVSLWTIMSKVRLEACMWGAGTAIGELPPYFMARAARLSGQMDEEEQELEELIHGKSIKKLTFLERAKVTVHNLVQKVGFIGILACASIPNPLFDLAGITCGHFLVPFWTFFGATLIGKAIIKMHIQQLTVIFVFSEHHVETVVKLLKHIPLFGKSLQAPFKEWLIKQKAKLHVAPGTAKTSGDSWLSWVFEKLVLLMVAYFVLSIVNSMAQKYHKRICEERNITSKHVGKEKS